MVKYVIYYKSVSNIFFLCLKKGKKCFTNYLTKSMSLSTISTCAIVSNSQ